MLLAEKGFLNVEGRRFPSATTKEDKDYSPIFPGIFSIAPPPTKKFYTKTRRLEIFVLTLVPLLAETGILESKRTVLNDHFRFSLTAEACFCGPLISKLLKVR